MSDDPTEALQLLDDLAKPEALGPGVVMVPLSSVGIFLSPDDLAKNPKLRAMRWPRNKQDHPAACAAWEKKSIELKERQDRERESARPKNTAAPVDKGKRPAEHEIRIVRI